MDNSVISAIMERRTVRAFKDTALTAEQLEILKGIAVTSPTAVNAQNWHFSFIQNAEIISQMEKDIVDQIMAGPNEAAKERTKARNNKVIYDAPLLILISSKPSTFAHVDAGIAVQSLAIAAKALGLESAILGMTGLAYSGPNGEEWKKKTMVPEGHEYVISIAIGYGNMPGNDKNLDFSKISVIK